MKRVVNVYLVSMKYITAYCTSFARIIMHGDNNTDEQIYTVVEHKNFIVEEFNILVYIPTFCVITKGKCLWMTGKSYTPNFLVFMMY